MTVRRAMALIVVFAVAALLSGWGLLHVQRFHTCGIQPVPGPCDPSVYLPFGWLTLALWTGASIALLIVATWLVSIGIRGVVRHDARVRAARRAREG